MPRKPKNAKETTKEVIDEIVNDEISELEETPVAEESVNKEEYVVCCVGYLRVRRGPGISYEEVDKLPNGKKITVIEINGKWAKIGPNRWVMRDFLMKGG